MPRGVPSYRSVCRRSALQCQTQCHTARNNRNFVNRISARVIAAPARVPLSWYAVFLFLVGQTRDCAQRPSASFLGPFQSRHQYEICDLPRRHKASFVGQAFKVRARESRCRVRDDREIHAVRNRFFAVCTRRISSRSSRPAAHNHSPVEAGPAAATPEQHIRRLLRRSGSRLR